MDEVEISLQKQVVMLRDLHALLQHEHDALEQHSYEVLVEIIDAKQQAIRRIERVSTPTSAAGDDPLLQERHELTRQCARLNLANGVRINRLTGLTQRSLDVIQGVDDEAYNMYSPSGSNIRSIESRLATVA